jgi:hypothetical protein
MSNRDRYNNRGRRTAPRGTTALLRVETNQLAALTAMVEMQKTTQRGFIERVPDVPRIYLKRDKVYTISRTSVTGTQMLNSTTVPIGYAFAPSLANFPNNSEIINLFEQWRIVQLVWSFTPLSNSVIANPLYTWFDPDDDSLPTGLNDAVQSETVRISSSGSFVERTFTPQLSVSGAANGTVTSGYISMPSTTWSDDQSSTNKHYGIKAVIAANTNLGNNVPLYSVEVTAIIQMRRPR